MILISFYSREKYFILFIYLSSDRYETVSNRHCLPEKPASNSSVIKEAQGSKPRANLKIPVEKASVMSSHFVQYLSSYYVHFLIA